MGKDNEEQIMQIGTVLSSGNMIISGPFDTAEEADEAKTEIVAARKDGHTRSNTRVHLIGKKTYVVAILKRKGEVLPSGNKVISGHFTSEEAKAARELYFMDHPEDNIYDTHIEGYKGRVYVTHP